MKWSQCYSFYIIIYRRQRGPTLLSTSHLHNAVRITNGMIINTFDTSGTHIYTAACHEKASYFIKGNKYNNQCLLFSIMNYIGFPDSQCRIHETDEANTWLTDSTQCGKKYLDNHMLLLRSHIESQLHKATVSCQFRRQLP